VEISSDHQIMILRSFCEGEKNGGNALPIPPFRETTHPSSCTTTQMVAGGLNLLQLSDDLRMHSNCGKKYTHITHFYLNGCLFLSKNSPPEMASMGVPALPRVNDGSY
jgi:hypothetical protein